GDWITPANLSRQSRTARRLHGAGDMGEEFIRGWRHRGGGVCRHVRTGANRSRSAERRLPCVRGEARLPLLLRRGVREGSGSRREGARKGRRKLHLGCWPRRRAGKRLATSGGEWFRLRRMQCPHNSAVRLRPNFSLSVTLSSMAFGRLTIATSA